MNITRGYVIRYVEWFTWLQQYFFHKHKMKNHQALKNKTDKIISIIFIRYLRSKSLKQFGTTKCTGISSGYILTVNFLLNICDEFLIDYVSYKISIMHWLTINFLCYLWIIFWRWNIILIDIIRLCFLILLIYRFYYVLNT